MRCPKCGYISFDLLENCVKCGKNIAGQATELSGTVVSMAPPAFLRSAGEGTGYEAEEAGVDVAIEEPLDLGDEREEVEMDFSSDQDFGAGGDEMEVDLGGDEDQFAIEAEESDEDTGFAAVAEEEGEEAIGISDLAPPEEAEIQIETDAEEGDTAGAGIGLEDLQVEGIDLEAAPDTAADSGKITPSVKTGTALDDFDIDLGDLLTSKKD